MRSARAHLAAIAFVLTIAAFSSCDKESPTEPTDCTATLTPSAFSFGAASGTGSIAVGIEAGCDWSAQSQATWLTITGGAGGEGPGTVAFAVAENPSESTRSGTLAVAGLTATVTQAGREPTPECTFTIAPEAATFNKDGGAGAVTVAAPDGCAWSAASQDSWVTIVSGASGSGNGVVNYTVGPNRDAAARTSVLSVAGRSAVVTQEPDFGACVYSVAPVDFDTCMPPAELTTTITTQAVCPWTATAGGSWITLSDSSGTGSGLLRLHVTENYEAPRQGVVMVRWPSPTEGQNVRVNQAGCVYAVTQSSFVVGSPGGAFSFDVLQQALPNSCGGALQDRCLWSAVSEVDWIVITTSMPRRGDDRVTFTVAPNPTHASRTGAIRVRDQVVHVMQGG